METTAAQDITYDTMPTSDNLVEQLAPFIGKYETALIPANAFNDEGATEEEIDLVMRAVLEANIAKRDEQIGHFEKLQELFEEALLCAKVPFGHAADGKPVQPTRSISVREFIDRNDEGEEDEEPTA